MKRTADEPGPCVGRTRIPLTLIAGCAGAIASAGSWALWPLPSRPLELPERDGAEALEEVAPVARLAVLDLEAFRAPIWVAEPPPPPPPASAPAPPPLRLQLLAITRDGDRLRAVLYDPGTDHLHVVADGQTVGGRTVDRVRADGVSILGTDGRATQTLSLRSNDASALPGGGR